ncbi:MAG: AAA family ATPase [Thermoguttaceae bacterium]
MPLKLKELKLAGYKSFCGGQTIPFGDVTVLLGANGAGKSNLVSFFNMLSFMMTGALQHYVGKQGVEQLLFYGRKQTERITFVMEFDDDDTAYEIHLSYGLPDRLFISGETVFQRQMYDAIGIGVLESNLCSDTQPISRSLYSFLSKIKSYQFHDTSETAKIKDSGYVDDAKYLRHDAGNLAAFLKRLKETSEHKKYYDRIVRTIRRVMPQFGDFDLASLPGRKDYVRLNWNDVSGSDYPFDPHQISDGSLRFMALATLLLQPTDLLPKFIVLDEPELGLHPAALTELSALVRTASQHSQILLATQSTRLVDEFSPENIVVIEQEEYDHDKRQQHSVVKKLNPDDLRDWLERYSLSELWEKNVLGGQP